MMYEQQFNMKGRVDPTWGVCKVVTDIENQKIKLCWKKAEPKKPKKTKRKAMKAKKPMKAMKTMKAMKKTTGKAKNPMKAAKSSS